jgi:hypothetical protein
MGRIIESEALPEDCLQKGQCHFRKSQTRLKLPEDCQQEGQCHFRKSQTKHEASRGLTPRGPVSLQENSKLSLKFTED